MKRVIKIAFLFSALSHTIHSVAQPVNLVPNPSFEEYSQCPDGQGQLERALGWINPNTSSPDYFNLCATSILSRIPSNAFGFQYPQDGNAHCGLFFVADNFSGAEYAQIQLSEKLKPNKKYCINFYVSLADKQSSFYMNKIGAYFSVNQITNTNQARFDQYIPQFFYDGINPLNDTSSWINIQGEFIAMGGEEYLTLGNFNEVGTDDTVFVGYPPSLSQKQCYFFIDNISVYCCDKSDCETAITIPNIFTPNGDQQNETFRIENLAANSNLTVYSRWGNIVYSNPNYGNNWDGELNSDGVYYYVLTLPTGETKHGTVTIIRNSE